MTRVPHRVCFVTCIRWPELSASDRVAADALRRRGVDVEARPWNGPDARFDGFDAVILRANWDYHFTPDVFLAWLDERERRGSVVWNAPALVRWNVPKTYLFDLRRQAVPVVPTIVLDDRGIAAVPEVMAAEGWKRAVVKPLVSASAHDTHLVDVADPAAIERLRAGAMSQPAMIQPFLEEIRTRGEWSVVFADGALTHAVLKRPAPGEFRVQPRLGGTAEALSPPEDVVRAACQAVAALSEVPLYARVDGVETAQGFLVMEVEVNEPGLFFHLAPAGAERFAEAVVRRLATL
jgi:glutathione synthase/RimK-type ligase-like ATP-grasp enzyme